MQKSLLLISTKSIVNYFNGCPCHVLHNAGWYIVQFCHSQNNRQQCFINWFPSVLTDSGTSTMFAFTRTVTSWLVARNATLLIKTLLAWLVPAARLSFLFFWWCFNLHKLVDVDFWSSFMGISHFTIYCWYHLLLARESYMARLRSRWKEITLAHPLSSASCPSKYYDSPPAFSISPPKRAQKESLSEVTEGVTVAIR